MTKSDFAKRIMVICMLSLLFPKNLPEFRILRFSMENHFKCGISEASNYFIKSKAIEYKRVPFLAP